MILLSADACFCSLPHSLAPSDTSRHSFYPVQASLYWFCTARSQFLKRRWSLSQPGAVCFRFINIYRLAQDETGRPVAAALTPAVKPPSEALKRFTADTDALWLVVFYGRRLVSREAEWFQQKVRITSNCSLLLTKRYGLTICPLQSWRVATAVNPASVAHPLV